MLRALQGLVAPSSHGVAVAVPQVYHFDEELRIQVIENLYPAVDLASLVSPTVSRNTLDATNIGVAVGSWLRAFHGWTSSSEQVELRREISGRCRPMRDLKRMITYDNLFGVLQRFPAILQKHEVALKQVEQLADIEFKQQPVNDEEIDDAWGIIHGDFWTGK